MVDIHCSTICICLYVNSRHADRVDRMHNLKQTEQNWKKYQGFGEIVAFEYENGKSDFAAVTEKNEEQYIYIYIYICRVIFFSSYPTYCSIFSAFCLASHFCSFSFSCHFCCSSFLF